MHVPAYTRTTSAAPVARHLQDHQLRVGAHGGAAELVREQAALAEEVALLEDEELRAAARRRAGCGWDGEVMGVAGFGGRWFWKCSKKSLSRSAKNPPLLPPPHPLHSL